MFSKLIKQDVDILNLSTNDISLPYNPEKLVDFNGNQYHTAVLNRFDSQTIFDLFEIYTVEDVHDYDQNSFDSELQDIIIDNIKIDGYKMIRTYKVQSKSQDVIDQVNERRQLENSIEYRENRKLAYIEEISPEKDPISTLGDVVDALYHVIQHGDTSKLEDLSVKIESIKQRFPKPQ